MAEKGRNSDNKRDGAARIPGRVRNLSRDFVVWHGASKLPAEFLPMMPPTS